MKDEATNKSKRTHHPMRSMLIFIMPAILCVGIRFALSPRLQVIHPARQLLPASPWPSLMSPWDAGVLGLLVGGVACLAVAVYFSRRLAAPSPSRASSGIFVFLAAIIVNGSIAIGGCVEGENLLWQHAQYYEKTTIKWEEPFDLEGATFSIDGTRVGKGLPAFAKVMRRLSSLHEGGGLTIQFPKKWNVMQFDGDSRTGDMWEFPFEGHLDKEKEFTKLCGEKNLLISFEVIE